MKLSYYSAYKDSGMDWLGRIPHHWTTKRAKYILTEINNRSTCGEETLLSVSEYYGIRPRSEIIEPDDFLTNASSLEGYKKCEPGDLVMNIMLAWKRGQGISPCKGIVSPAYAVFRPASNEIFSKYLHYLTCSEIYVGLFGSWSYGVIPSRWRLYPEVFLKLPILLPPIKEQIAIAGFLDKKTSAIDNLIQKKQRQIELLQEKRSALIAHAVTKGLDPDVRMKDSGVEWLGEVPEHWELIDFKRLGDFKSGAGFPDHEQGFPDEEIPFFKVSDTNIPGNSLFMYEQNNSVSEESALRLGAFIFQKNTVIFAKVGAALLLNKRRILTRPSCIDNNMMGFTPRHCYYKWIYYWLCNLDLCRLANPGAVPSVNEGQIKEIKVAVPSARGQQYIADFLDCKIAGIDALVDKINQSISTLHEYRSALITAAVTGKIDVRGSVA